jgi:hypothetical protein
MDKDFIRLIFSKNAGLIFGTIPLFYPHRRFAFPAVG